ncbi:Peptidyl-prolyl cis-trans isomerase [Nostocoides japonicum T1-X7]|uniref:Peptidyl-prolyl cis-trans isomerase n=1 Tax=Nostocoides japonicum T1-X7 TaxID=1194083 RepID=A0A077LX65_9MICO|nr:FKBP-type peptidyl-prolyl cis-trans isomerase [Tetrasphaera japonica]CCH76579.1 Peptidyl-prolyl cis-trans isomerase [Tetrasphaera japonica T1-X7]
MNSRARVAAVLLAASTLVVAACGSGGSSSSSSSSSASGQIAAVKVVGADAKKTPAITLPEKPFKVTKTETRVITEGKGATLKSGQVASVSLAVVNGTSGKTVNSNYESAPTGLPVGDTTVIAGLKKALDNQKIGSRVLVAIPPADGFGTQGATSLGIAADDTMVVLMDIRSAVTMLPAATGTAVAPKKGLPTVVFNKDKAATITIPKGEKAPTKLVVQPLVEGTGATVKKGQTVRATYTGVLWRNGKVFDSAWAHDPAYIEFPAGEGQVIKGWDTSVVGQKVGSRLLLVVPPAQGYGSAGSGEIKGTDTMVFVMDILGAY